MSEHENILEIAASEDGVRATVNGDTAEVINATLNAIKRVYESIFESSPLNAIMFHIELVKHLNAKESEIWKASPDAEQKGLANIENDVELLKQILIKNEQEANNE